MTRKTMLDLVQLCLLAVFVVLLAVILGRAIGYTIASWIYRK